MRRILVQDLSGTGEDPSVHRKSDHVLHSTIYSSQYCPGLCRGGEVRGGPAGRVPGVPDHGLHAAALRHPCHGRQVRVSGLCLARDEDPITDIMAALTARKPAPKSQFIVPSHSLQPPC